jgi:hypothetical protein
MMVLAGAVAASCAASLAVTAGPAVGAVAQAGGWGKAIEVPGLARLSAGFGGVLADVSCSSPGNCAAGGTYTTDASGHSQAFVVSEKNGTWSKAIEVPGLGALNTGDEADLLWLSCGSAGNCAAGGDYSGTGGSLAFVVSEKNGTWGKAMQVPGLAALNGATGGSSVNSVSCASAGNCTAGGIYSTTGYGQVFVVSEKNGTWGKAMQVPGLAALNGATGGSSVNSVSCASAGNCTAGGIYSTTGYGQVFVVSEKNGTWGKAMQVPGLAALDAGSPVGVSSVSCASAGNCAVAGTYGVSPGVAFVVSQKNGWWGKAIEVPGSAALGGVTLASVSCGSAGNCTAAGYLGDRYSLANLGPLAVSEKNGTWSKAIPIPGTTASARNGAASVSCASAGNCAAGGDYAPSIEGPYQAFVVSQKNGMWGKAIEVPGSAALNVGGSADVVSVSCGSAGNCVAGGYYQDGADHQQAFVVSENNGSWGRAIEVPGSGALNTGGGANVVSASCTAAGYCAAGGEYSVVSGNEQPFLVSRT